MRLHLPQANMHRYTHMLACIDTVAGQDRARQGRAGQGRGRSRSSSRSRREPGGQGQTHSPERKLDIFWRGKVPVVSCPR